MKNQQRAKKDSYDRIEAFDVKYAVELTLIPVYTLEQKKFDDAFNEITKAGDKQAIETKGLKNDSDAAKNAMANVCIKYALRGSVMARMANNQELATQLIHHKTYILAANKQMAMERAIDIRNALNDNLTICNNVTAADIAEIDAAIAAFKLIEPQPIIARQVKKAMGTDVLPPQFAVADEAIENMYHLVYSYYNESKPQMVGEMKLAMQIINTGIRHTGILAFVTVNNGIESLQTPAQGVVMKIVELNLIATSDINGLAGLSGIKPGTYHMEFTGQGLVTKTFIQAFNRGHMIEMEVEMEK